MSLQGDGIGISTLEWTAVGGIRYAPTVLSSPSGADDGRELSISKLTLRTQLANGGSAIVATWPEANGQYAITAYIKEVEIRETSFTQYWGSGIVLTGARQSVIEDVTMVGASSTSYSVMDKGLQIISNNNSTEYKIRNLNVYAANRGVIVQGGVAGTGSGPEGIYIDSSTFVNVGTGVYVNTADSEPVTFVRGSHINAHLFGIDSEALNSVYANNEIQTTDSGGVGIRVTGNPINVLINSNVFHGTQTGSGSNGVVLQANVSHSSVVNNHFLSGITCVWLQTGTQANFIAQNVFNGCTTNALNQGSNTVFGWGAGTP